MHRRHTFIVVIILDIAYHHHTSHSHLLARPWLNAWGGGSGCLVGNTMTFGVLGPADSFALGVSERLVGTTWTFGVQGPVDCFALHAPMVTSTCLVPMPPRLINIMIIAQLNDFSNIILPPLVISCPRLALPGPSVLFPHLPHVKLSLFMGGSLGRGGGAAHRVLFPTTVPISTTSSRELRGAGPGCGCTPFCTILSLGCGVMPMLRPSHILLCTANVLSIMFILSFSSCTFAGLFMPQTSLPKPTLPVLMPPSCALALMQSCLYRPAVSASGFDYCLFWCPSFLVPVFAFCELPGYLGSLLSQLFAICLQAYP